MRSEREARTDRATSRSERAGALKGNTVLRLREPRERDVLRMERTSAAERDVLRELKETREAMLGTQRRVLHLTGRNLKAGSDMSFSA